MQMRLTHLFRQLEYLANTLSSFWDHEAKFTLPIFKQHVRYVTEIRADMREKGFKLMG